MNPRRVNEFSPKSDLFKMKKDLVIYPFLVMGGNEIQAPDNDS